MNNLYKLLLGLNMSSRIKVFFVHNQSKSLIGILLGGIYRLGVKGSFCVHRGLSLLMGHTAGVHVVRGQSHGHCSQALDGQPEQLSLVGL